jgi:hypothetical protein
MVAQRELSASQLARRLKATVAMIARQKPAAVSVLRSPRSGTETSITPEGRRGSLAQEQGRHRGGHQRQRADNHRDMNGLGVKYSEAGEKRKSDDNAEPRYHQPPGLLAVRRRRVHREKIDDGAEAPPLPPAPSR